MRSSDHSRQRAIAILLVSAFVVILNETTMNVALNQIMIDLRIGERTAQWLTTAFMLTMAVVIPITGWMLDRLTTRRVFLLSVMLFSLGTALGAVAPTFTILLVGRVVQASGTAMMMPLLMTTIMRLVHVDGLGRVMGNVSMVIAVAPAIGPTLSGLLLHIGSWRLIFAVVLPIAILVGVLGALHLPNVGDPSSAPLDVASVPLAAFAFGPLIYGLSLLGADVPFWQPMLAIGIGLGALLAFIARQLVLQRSEAAFLDLRTFTFGPFLVSVIMLALGTMALFGTIIMLPLLLQRAYAMKALYVGLMMLPGGIIMGLLGPVFGRVFDRFGPRVLVVPASFVILAVFFGFSALNADSPWWLIMVGHILMSVSFAATFTPLFTVALGALPSNLHSHGSATVSALQQVAGAAGTALFVTVFAMQSDASNHAQIADRLLEGSHWAFLVAGAIWTAAVGTAWFVRRPDNPADAATV